MKTSELIGAALDWAAAEAGYFVRAEAAADLAFRVRCALAKETLED